MKRDAGMLLVIDDEPMNRDLLRRVLGGTYQVVEAASADEARKLLEEHGDSLQVLLCDHLMPSESGSDFLVWVHERRTTLVSVLLTGVPDAPEVGAAVKAGAVFELVAKPLLVGHLRAVVKRAVAEHRRRVGS